MRHGARRAPGSSGEVVPELVRPVAELARRASSATATHRRLQVQRAAVDREDHRVRCAESGEPPVPRATGARSSSPAASVTTASAAERCGTCRRGGRLAARTASQPPP